MIISLGFVRSTSQLLIKDFDWTKNSLESRLIDIVDLQDQNLSGLFVEDDDHFSSLVSILEKEKSFYPIIDARNEDLSYTSFEQMGAHAFKELALKVINRWTMIQNFNSIENVYKIITHFRELWQKDRLSFFEEFWYWMKRNLGAVDLSIIFNDVTSVEEKDDNNEKKERPKLTQSLISGTKKGHFLAGGAKEKELMSSYFNQSQQAFEVTEMNPEKGQFVATAQIEGSPVLMMARVPNLNQLQRTTIAAIFNGL
ncbi:MAG TPA: hypothetical protein VKY27_10835 [Bacteriovoracaceae bacterium]|nr:hypothetical protein [Bacteriovoracaceae bacterium]